MHNKHIMPQSPSSASGQILVMVLLVVLVGMTIGISIASRSLTSLKNAGDLDFSNRAFSAAEAGIEHALSPGVTCSPTCSSASVGGSAAGYTVTAANVGGNSGEAYGINKAIAQDDVAQLILNDGTTVFNKAFYIYWSDASEFNSSCTTIPALVVSVLYKNSAGTSYGLAKQALDYCPSGTNRPSGGDNFSTAGISNATGFGTLPAQNGQSIGPFALRTLVNVPTLIGAGNTPVLARVRFMFNASSKTAFIPVLNTDTLPVQGQEYTSTGKVDGTGKQRTVKVFRSAAQLPAIFDFALFNGSSTNALTK